MLHGITQQLLGQVGRLGYTGLYQRSQEAAPEGIACAAGIHAVGFQSGDLKNLTVPVCAGTLAAQSFDDQGNVLLAHQSGDVCLAAHHIGLFIGNLQKIHIGQNVHHSSCAGALIVVPHQIAVVYIKGDQFTPAMTLGKGINSGIGGVACRQ